MNISNESDGVLDLANKRETHGKKCRNNLSKNRYGLS